MNFILTGIFACTFFLEGLGLTRQQDIFGLIYCGITIFFMFLSLKKKIVFPIFFSILYIVFLIFSLISSLNFSLDKEISFSWWLFYLSCFLIFIFFYNFKEIGKNIVNKIIFYLIPIFIILFLLKKNLSQLFFIKNLPLSENNLFFDYNPLHNHLGVIVGLFILFFIWKFIKENKIKNIILALILFPILLFSYNRSAILAFLITLIPLIIFFSRNKAKTTIVIIFLFIVGLSFLMLSSGYQPKIIKFSQIQTKGIFGSREIYWKQGVQSFLEKPIFGIGYGNFGYASYKYQQGYDQWIDNAANIFLEILTGGGIFAFIPFVIIIGLIFLSALRSKSIYSLLFIFLFTNFQTDFSYRNYSLFVFFIILAAIIYQEKKEEKEKKIFISLVLILSTLLLLLITSNYFFFKGKSSLAQKIFPLNKKTYSLLIKEKLNHKDNKSAIKMSNLLGFISPLNCERLVTAGKLYETLGDKKQALKNYKQICELNKYCDLLWIKKISQLTKEIYSEKEVFIYLQDRIEIYSKIRYLSDYLENLVESEIKKTCLDLTNNKECYFLNIQKLKNLYEPEANTIQEEINKVYKVKYTINKDTLNERFNYSIKKGEEVYRIMTLGNGFTFGQYVDTNKNWTELLEDKLNKKIKCANIKKFEVINLGVYNYDIGEAVERYKERGEKYNPDLIIWPIFEIYKLNEPSIKKIKFLKENNTENLTDDEIWAKSQDQIKQEIGESAILEKQKKQLERLTTNLQSKIIFINTGEVGENEKKILPKNLNFVDMMLTENKYYPGTGLLNNNGHQLLAEEIYKYLTEEPLINCQK